MLYTAGKHPCRFTAHICSAQACAWHSVSLWVVHFVDEKVTGVLPLTTLDLARFDPS